MDQLNLRGKGAVIAGLRGSGKTVFGRNLIALDPDAALAYDPRGQYKDLCDTIQPKHHEFPAAADELARILDRAGVWKPGFPYRLLVIDEAPDVAPNQKSLHPDISKLNREHRHLGDGGLTVAWITQRPRDLHVKIVSLADHLFIYRLTGATDVSFLENTVRGLGDTVAGLEPYEFAHVDQFKRVKRCMPVEELPSPK